MDRFPVLILLTFLIPLLTAEYDAVNEAQSKKPILELTKREYQFSYDDSIRIVVKLTQGIKPITYKWQFNDGPLPQGVMANGLVFVISNFQKSTEGIYSLRAENQFGWYKLHLRINANNIGSGDLNKKPVLSLKKRIYSVAVGSSLRISIQKLSGSEPMSYHWSFDNMQVPIGVSANGLIFSINQARIEQGGIYMLHAKNKYGWYKLYIRIDVHSPESQRPEIKIDRNEYIVSIGKPFRLAPKILNISPSDKFVWLFNGKNVLPNGIVVTNNVLTISSMTVEFFGVYTLVVTNNFGTSTISIIISLNGDDNGGPYFTTTTQSTYYTTDYLTSDSTAVWSTATTTRYVTITDYYTTPAVWPTTTSKYYTTTSAWTMTSDWSTTTTGYVFTTDYTTTTAYITDYSTTNGFTFTTDYSTTTAYITDYSTTTYYTTDYSTTTDYFTDYSTTTGYVFTTDYSTTTAYITDYSTTTPYVTSPWTTTREYTTTSVIWSTQRPTTTQTTSSVSGIGTTNFIETLNPIIIVQQTVYYVMVGQSNFVVNLSVLQGTAPLSFIWMFNNQPQLPHGIIIINNGRGIRLTIAATTIMTGKYTVIVKNAYGKFTVSFLIIIKDDSNISPPNPITGTAPLLQLNQLVYIKPFNSPLSVQVLIKAGTKPLRFQWFFNGRPKLPQFVSIRQQIIRITKITNSNIGTYSLHVSNPFGSDSVTFEVKPQIQNDNLRPRLRIDKFVYLLRPGSSLRIVTQLISGGKPVTFEWFRMINGKFIKQLPNNFQTNGLILNIQQFQPSQEGKYILKAKNEWGIDEIQLYVAPIHQPVPIITLPNEIVIRIGQTKKPLNVVGKMLTNVKVLSYVWHFTRFQQPFQRLPLPNNVRVNRNVLTILQFSSNIEGYYIITANTIRGKAYARIRIIIEKDNSCKFNGNVYDNNERFDKNNCVKNCICRNGIIKECLQIVCPHIGNYCLKKIKRKESCCEECVQFVNTPKKNCRLPSGKIIKHGGIFDRNQCELNCRCENGKIEQCARVSCAPLPTNCVRASRPAGYCCKICVERRTNEKKTCRASNGIEYSHGEIFDDSNCLLNCKCVNGKRTDCWNIKCPNVQSDCLKSVVVPGKCCNVCVKWKDEVQIIGKKFCLSNSGVFQPVAHMKRGVRSPCEQNCLCKDGKWMDCSIIQCSQPPKQCRQLKRVENQCCSICVDKGLRPRLRSPTRFFSFTIGQSGSIQVHLIQGNQPIKYEWTFNKMPINQLPTGVQIIKQTVLQFSNVSPNMNGVYRLTARNNYGADVIHFFVTIGGGVKPILQKVDDVFRLSKGTSFSLNPNLLAGSGKITYIWSFNNNPSLPNGVKVNGKTISIVQVNNIHQGIYRLTARNSFGQFILTFRIIVSGKKPELIVADNQVVVYKGTNFPLMVHLRSGSEPVTIQWKRNGQIIRRGLSSNNRQLMLRNIQINMGGLYTITATNNYGKSTVTISVKVVDRQTGTHPIISIPHSYWTIIQNTRLVINVSIKNIAKPFRYTLLRNGKSVNGVIFDMNSSKIIINRADIRMNGKYTLTIYGSGGITKTNFWLIVKKKGSIIHTTTKKPKFVILPKDQFSFIIGKKYIIKVRFLDAESGVNVNLVRKDGKIVCGIAYMGQIRSIVVTGATFDMAGQYQLIATTKYGRQVFPLNISVRRNQILY
ncbi:hypothetical protein SNEBB_007092 [Seison nebaliae]|nr:hypothetical protein SNEBB_007092 [Seison nebaliae]